MKEQETLEEAAKNYGWRIKRNPFSDAVKANELADSAANDFIEGGNWQSKRMYSEEEKELMIKIFHSYWFENNPEHEDNLKEWELSKKLFEQFKKK